METYQHDFSRLKQAFVRFLQNLPFYGSAILCVDDANVREIHALGSQADRDLRNARGRNGSRNRDRRGGRMRFKAKREGASTLEITLKPAGDGTTYRNALAAIAVATELGVPDAAIRKGARRIPRSGPALPALRRDFSRPERRPAGSFTLVDDYGIHPVEMRATLDAARGAFPGPAHRARLPAPPLPRTRRPVRGFRESAFGRGRAAAAEVYPAGETPIVAPTGARSPRRFVLRARRTGVRREDLRHARRHPQARALR